jgi:soluble P-type ATPase
MVIVIPEYGKYNIKNLVFDYNGTLAEGGSLKGENLKRLHKLTENFEVYVITADTFGSVKKIFENSAVKVNIISRETGTRDKERLVETVGARETIAIGNGFNDRLMLKAAALGFCIAGPEGASTKALLSSDVVLGKIEDFFLMMEEPKRLIATLRG